MGFDRNYNFMSMLRTYSSEVRLRIRAPMFFTRSAREIKSTRSGSRLAPFRENSLDHMSQQTHWPTGDAEEPLT